MKEDSVYEFISKFNRSDFRRSSVPQELVSGWPCVHRMGKSLCITIPYYARSREDNRIALYPLYCSATVPVDNPNRLMDFTVYPYQKEWNDVDYAKPAGYFKHAALEDVTTKEQYKALCDRLYGYYDRMVAAVEEGRAFGEEAEMREIFTRLMEPGHYPQYLRINEKFYSYFCRLQ